MFWVRQWGRSAAGIGLRRGWGRVELGRRADGAASDVAPRGVRAAAAGPRYFDNSKLAITFSISGIILACSAAGTLASTMK